MKKWENAEIAELGLEKTKTEGVIVPCPEDPDTISEYSLRKCAVDRCWHAAMKGSQYCYCHRHCGGSDTTTS